jgi:hypothetical protein
MPVDAGKEAWPPREWRWYELRKAYGGSMDHRGRGRAYERLHLDQNRDRADARGRDYFSVVPVAGHAAHEGIDAAADAVDLLPFFGGKIRIIAGQGRRLLSWFCQTHGGCCWLSSES